MKHINSGLFAAIVVINLYIIVLPVLPAIRFWFDSRDSNRVAALASQTTPPADDEPVPADAQIITIPRLMLEADVQEAASTSTVLDDIWRRPNTSSPDQGGNTVIVGHRFTYTNPNGVFYHLDKLQPNDTIALDWHGKRYVYRVDAARVVPATAINVEAATEEPRLTLYTCTPLWNPTERLVVTARLERTYD